MDRQRQTLVMGIVNVTPDSFSDGGKWASPAAATERGLLLLEQGAAILDVGGESTRPGAARISADDEASRVLPVIRSLVAAGATVSVDTMRAEVAAQAVEAGAAVINDVSGGLADQGMFAVVAGSGVDYVLMHWRGHSAEMDRLSSYTDVVSDVRTELISRTRAAEDAGVSPERIIIDVGIGFAKQPAQCWELLAHIDEFNNLGYRQLLGVSRKRFLGEVTGRAAADRDAASAAVTFLAAQHGVWGVRTHVVAEHVDAIRVAERLGGCR